ncbi:MAG: nucleoside 2-deoxyribosyltransferase [Candidatus Moranbacteria bacterium]|nr:nucleoside 2-deoxyribosyltransferase [Candidatus Moranbacteria bacterium]
MERKMKTITFSGSMTFLNEMKEIKKELEEKGFTVLLPDEGGFLGKENETEISVETQRKNSLTGTLKKIKQSDAVLVVDETKNNIENYIGANTFLEMGVTYAPGKKIFLWNDFPSQPNTLEIKAMEPVVLCGDVMEVIV